MHRGKLRPIDDQDRRALYAEAGLMLRMCDTLTAGFIQYYAAIAAAAAAALAADLLPAEAFGWILGVASALFLSLSLRIRRNYSQLLQSSLALERDMVGARIDLAPHTNNQRRHREFGVSFVPMVWLYASFYVAGLAVAVIVGMTG